MDKAYEPHTMEIFLFQKSDGFAFATSGDNDSPFPFGSNSNGVSDS